MSGISKILSISPVTTLIATVVIALISLLILSTNASRLGLMDFPTDRKRHAHPVPAVGGLSIYLTICIISIFVSIPEEFMWLIFVAGGLVLSAQLMTSEV